MTQGFQQQDRGLNFSFPKSVPAAQHGRRPDREDVPPPRQPRTVEPRPGH